MVFIHSHSVHDHINNKIDASVSPEEKHHILQGNIGSRIAGNTRLHYTELNGPSILGIAGDTIRPEKILTTEKGKALSQTGKLVDVPHNFYDDSSPLLFGESGHGLDWKVLNNEQNNVGYSLDFNGNRSLGFPHHAVAGTEIEAIPHSPPIEISQINEQVTASWKPLSTAFPGLGAPIGDWTKTDN